MAGDADGDDDGGDRNAGVASFVCSKSRSHASLDADGDGDERTASTADACAGDQTPVRDGMTCFL